MYEVYCSVCDISEMMIDLVPKLKCPKCKYHFFYKELEGDNKK